jgi:hypothetical protein
MGAENAKIKSAQKSAETGGHRGEARFRKKILLRNKYNGLCERGISC